MPADLPDTTEELLSALRDISYERQSLETLLDLATQLKNRRLALFPDQPSYAFT